MNPDRQAERQRIEDGIGPLYIDDDRHRAQCQPLVHDDDLAGAPAGEGRYDVSKWGRKENQFAASPGKLSLDIRLERRGHPTVPVDQALPLFDTLEFSARGNADRMFGDRNSDTVVLEADRKGSAERR
uniref:hypothetical protein n=1 Tax=Neorhizobium sp. EC2-8 TaxID=3129230 RepID=UPI00310171BB